MIFCDLGIVLGRKIFREADRQVCLYTRSHGRMSLHFGGVNRPAGKLKALSEPLTWGDYRIYVHPRSNSYRAIGGKSLSVFPLIRADFDRTCTALHFCELFIRLTPEHQPSPEKYALLLDALRELELRGTSPWLVPAFTLRLLHLAGFGLKNTAVGIDSRVWDRLHEADFKDMREMTASSLLGQIQALVAECLENQLDQPLKTSRFLQTPHVTGLGEVRLASVPIFRRVCI